jgi:CubicO group peptidase (beta-lactamase class C family)
MDSGTLPFDGVAYPDGRASDPRRLGWMEGAPPPPGKQVRFAGDRFLDFPQIRWSLSHMRELVPTVHMWWVTHNEMDAFEARGIHGQRLHVAPKADLVVARFASHPVAASAANDPITLPAFLALARLLHQG